MLNSSCFKNTNCRTAGNTNKISPHTIVILDYWFCKIMTGQSVYLNHRQHALIIVWVGVDCKVVVGISVNDRVHGSPSSCRGVISIVHCQVYHDAFRAFIY